MIAINTFRKKFADSQPKIIKQGLHFRDNTLLETLDAYVKAASQWNYDDNKCALFEDGVLSCVLLYVPAVFAQEFSQGLYYCQDKAEKFVRRETLRDGKNNFYLALRGSSMEFSLPGSGVDIVFGAAPVFAGPGDGWRAGDAGVLAVASQNLCRTKTSNLQSLCSQIHVRSLGA